MYLLFFASPIGQHTHGASVSPINITFIILHLSLVMISSDKIFGKFNVGQTDNPLNT